MSEFNLAEDVNSRVIIVPDFPIKGVPFKDITPVFNSPRTLKRLAIWMFETSHKALPYLEGNTAIGAIESRGFVLGAALASLEGLPLVLFRKPGKLPRKVATNWYTKEYGEDSLSVHEEDLRQYKQILIVDDVLATGGTIRAANDLAWELGVQPYNMFVYDLSYLRTPEFNSGAVKTWSLIRE